MISEGFLAECMATYYRRAARRPEAFSKSAPRDFKAAGREAAAYIFAIRDELMAKAQKRADKAKRHAS